MDVDCIFGNPRTAFVPRKSAIYVWGYNQNGQTARNGKERQLRIPKPLPHECFGSPSGFCSRWLDVACGREHTAAVASDGSLFTWGANEFGQLGDGTEVGRRRPGKVKNLQDECVISVACGAHCTAAITEIPKSDEHSSTSTGRLWIWGQNQGSNYPRLYWGAFRPNTVIKQVSCGAAHVVALSEDGVLQAWGYNEHGELGRGRRCEGLQGPVVITSYARFLDDPPETISISRVSCGEHHTAAVCRRGDVYTWGLGTGGQLGHCTLHSGDGELIPRRVTALDGTHASDVSCGGVHTCALTTNGALYAWGGGVSGHLALGPPDNRFLRNFPVRVIPDSVRHVACGHSHTLVCMKDSRVYGWGYNGYGQAADVTSTYAWFPSTIDWCVGEVRKLAGGGGHSAILSDASSLKELCEFRLARSLTPQNSLLVEDVASRTGSDALARLCLRIREYVNEVEEAERGS